ncbi:PhzF family phenazine biosynthesis protein [Synechocystis sp. PCC 7509]|uniref:PhzF family phenazine biosynthesis protein n=1 Tax=Synechocystis sp. PCC 7509 TaxID=927677 RepID=UPI0002ACEB2A|nr:PhzF family phenazine biosynthesis protein [Synechocystis sp. PCC 7509]
MKYYIVDVFAQEKYNGNQLAVFVDAGSLTSHKMQRITKEINYSETAFITNNESREGGYDVRIFTPAQELPFAGHPTLGTAYIIQQEIVKQPVEKVTLNLKVGQIPVTLHYVDNSLELLWMQQKPPIFEQIFATKAIAQVLNLPIDDIDSNFPIQEVSTGLPFIIVPLKTLAAIKKAKVNLEKCFELISNTEAKSILIFCPETYHPENNLNVRVFCDYFGVPEDPATGSANGCLAGYLANYAYFGADSVDIRV